MILLDKRANLSRRGRPKPNGRMSDKKAKFEIVTHSYLPPLIPTWQFGLERVNADKTRAAEHLYRICAA